MGQRNRTVLSKWALTGFKYASVRCWGRKDLLYKTLLLFVLSNKLSEYLVEGLRGLELTRSLGPRRN